MKRRSALLAVILGSGTALAAILAACTGDPGEPGAAGTPGAQGVAGQQGNEGTPGKPGDMPDASFGPGGACTQPCHTFGGVVDQWRFSNHSHPQKSDVGGGSCGHCHGIDGIQNRVANLATVGPDAGPPNDVTKGHFNYRTATGTVAEAAYAGAATIARIHCSTCHDFNPQTDPHVKGSYVAGQAPLRVPGGATDTAFIEKSPDAGAVTGQALAVRSANLCVFCHKSRKDVTHYIAPTNNVLSSVHWGPHAGPQADVVSGKGGYEFAGEKYSQSAHATIANACVACHMQPVAANANVPDHTMKPKVTYCKTCHTTYQGTTFDVQGGQATVKRALFELEALLNDAGWITRSVAAPYEPLGEDELADAQFHHDEARPRSGPGGTNLALDADQAGILYNYLVLARGKDFGVHNPTYAKQLLWDSIKRMKNGVDPTSLPSRPL